MAGRRRKRRLRTWTLVVPALALFGALAFANKDWKPQARQFGTPRLLAQIKESRLKESSGIAPSQRKDDVFYTFNDSGDSARFFQFNTAGKVLNVFNVSSANNLDWEDMASASLDGKPYLYFGDIGDNAGARKSIFVYRVPEPTGKSAKADQVLELRYPDGAHNAEALLVHPKTGDITIVTKTTDIAAVYSVARPASSGSYTLVKLGQIDLIGIVGSARLITGGAWSQDGQYVVLRTYLGAYEFSGSDAALWFENARTDVPTNVEMQGEAITYTRDGNALLTTSEGSPCPVSIIPVTTN
jgi:hypothetical protein